MQIDDSVSQEVVNRLRRAQGQIGGIIAMEAREPPMSGLPETSTSVPSSFTASEAELSPPMLNKRRRCEPRWQSCPTRSSTRPTTGTIGSCS